MLFFQLLSNPLFAVVWVVAMLYAVTIHEFSHALAAKLLGDDTPVEQGRLTLNPLSHIDGMGLIMLLLVGFGWGRPVEFNPLRLRGGRVASALVGLAGPFSNIASVAALSGITRFLLSSGRYTAENLMIQFFIFLVLLNLNLFAFNLLPIPPLDGSRIAAGVLPRPWDREYLKIEPYGFLIVLVLYFTGALYAWVIPGINLLASFLGIPKLYL